ncbi:hypothetical protein ACXYVG_00160 [Mesomycoplasma ovipneumoniae]
MDWRPNFRLRKLRFYTKKLFTELSKFHQQKNQKLANLIDKLTKLTMKNTKN